MTLTVTANANHANGGTARSAIRSPQRNLVRALRLNRDSPSCGNWSTHNYYHADGNGNVTYLVNSSQTRSASYRYDPYGNALIAAELLSYLGGIPNTYRFSSKLLDLKSGLYSYGYRWYAPNVQRWLNRDPIGELGGLNLYGYVRNDPLDRYDPFGEADAPKDQPPVTSPPIFGEKPFKPGKDNCLCYALDRPGGELQPDGGSGVKNGKNCKDLLAQIKKNYGSTDVPKGGTCPAGTHKIAVYSDGDGGYHVQPPKDRKGLRRGESIACCESVIAPNILSIRR